MPFFIEILLRLLIEGLQASAERKRQQVYYPPPPPAPPPPTAEELKRVVAAVTARLDALGRAAQIEAARCAGEAPNERFVPTLGEFIPEALGHARRRLAAQGAAAALPVGHLANRLQTVLATASLMAEQRRDRSLLLLLGDADALADACYAPVIEFARSHDIRLTSDRTATYLGDKSLAIFTSFDTTGLAPIVLPPEWATELAWWPALAHEIGHDFLASVGGLDRELRLRLSLPDAKDLPDGRYGLTTADLDRAFSAWLDEIFADCFGTLMLGPAYVHTMIWSFADSEQPQSVRIIQPDGGRTGYEEHPPAHLRVLLACNLLSEIGFPLDADRLEAEWRRRHKAADPQDRFYMPTRIGTWVSVSEDSFTERGARAVSTIYEGAFEALAGIPLRSIPGLDLGPREHQAAIDAKAAYFAGRPAATRDPRALIAGAVLAWHEKPSLAAGILRAARSSIRSVGVTRRRLRERAARDFDDAASVDGDPLDLSLARDALILDAILNRPHRRPW